MFWDKKETTFILKEGNGVDIWHLLSLQVGKSVKDLVS